MKVCVVVTARPSWTKLQTICEALRQMLDVELQIVACASALLERYGRVVDVIKAQGFTITEEVWSTYEGANLVTAAQETGGLLNLLAPVLSRLRSDVVVGCADRHEVLAIAQAAAYQHIPFGHLQGGERTGSIDDRVRDSITALADYHFPCTEFAAFRVYNLTGSDRVWNFGCSAIDLAKRAQSEPPVTAEELGGAGASIDLSQPFGVILQHPCTDEADDAHAQMLETLHAIPEGLQPIVWWPGQDSGSDASSKAIREFREQIRDIHTVRNLPPSRFLRLMNQCAVIIGNSSASVREGAYLGTPAVVIGTRQHGRERGPNVMDVPHDRVAIREAIECQLKHGRYPSSNLYGSGDAGLRIAETLRRLPLGSGATFKRPTTIRVGFGRPRDTTTDTVASE